MNQELIEQIVNWLGAGSINIFGPPFSGKDTQAKRLADTLGAAIIAGGEILRSYHDQTTIKKLSETGELFPTDFYLGVIIPFLSQASLANKPLVLSSVGRWHGEEEAIIQATHKANHPLKAVVNLQHNEAEIWRRFEHSFKKKDRGLRHDDAEHILKVRLQEFHLKTLPVIEFYRNKGLLIEVDGSHSPQKVTNHIIKALAKFAKI